jgi:hypothetical protein
VQNTQFSKTNQLFYQNAYASVTFCLAEKTPIPLPPFCLDFNQLIHPQVEPVQQDILWNLHRLSVVVRAAEAGAPVHGVAGIKGAHLQPQNLC